MMNENFVKRLNELMTEKGLKNYYQLSANTKIQYQTIKNWIERDTLPKTDLLIVLADFFDTSTDYILGRVDDFGNYLKAPPSNLSPKEADYTTEEKRIIAMLRKLPPEMKHVAVGAIEAVSKIELQREEQADKAKKADRL